MQVPAQTSFDRPGNDYSHSVSQSGDPAECAMLCERDKRCRAWSLPRVSIQKVLAALHPFKNVSGLKLPALDQLYSSFELKLSTLLKSSKNLWIPFSRFMTLPSVRHLITMLIRF